MAHRAGLRQFWNHLCRDGKSSSNIQLKTIDTMKQLQQHKRALVVEA